MQYVLLKKYRLECIKFHSIYCKCFDWKMFGNVTNKLLIMSLMLVRKLLWDERMKIFYGRKNKGFIYE